MVLQKLSSEKDLDLMMEFRGQHWEDWEEFCKINGYEAEVDEE